MPTFSGPGNAVARVGGGLELVSTVSASGATQTANLATANWFDITLNANAVTVTVTGFTNGAMCRGGLIVKQDATGNRILTIAGLNYLGAASNIVGSFSQHLTAGAADVIEFWSDDGGTTLYVGWAAALGVDLAAANQKPSLPLSAVLFSGAATGNTTVAAANCAELTAFVLERRTTLTKVMMVVATQSGNVDVGIYDSTGAGSLPNNRLAANGGSACPAAPASAWLANAVALSAPVTLPPGLYWAALAVDNITANFNYVSSAVKWLMTVFPGGAVRARCTAGGMYPLPAVAASPAFWTTDQNVLMIQPAAA